MIHDVIKRLARSRADLLAEVRRDLHRIPETSGEEFKTTAYIMDFLKNRAIDFEATSAGTGAVATFGSGEECLLLRADIDALPVSEETGAGFASEQPGMMHACGHDVHAAILLGVADALASGEMPFGGRVALLFQPAEEGKGGLRTLVRQGFIRKYRPRRAVALHVWPGLAAGRAAVAAGPVMAGVNYVRVSFTGRGGHGSAPHMAPDTVAAAAHFLTGVQAVLTRKADPLGNFVLTFGSIHGGSAPNIIPTRVVVEGTMRWYEEEAARMMKAAIESAAGETGALYGCGTKVFVDEGYVPTVNSALAVAELLPELRAVLGEDAVDVALPTMGAEDMGFILREVEGCYLQLGAGLSGHGAEPLHCPKFLPEEECLTAGVKLMLAAVSAYNPAPR